MTIARQRPRRKMTAGISEITLLRSKIVKESAVTVQRRRRSYTGVIDWIAIYTEAGWNGELIDTIWMVENKYSTNRVSARQMLHRHVKAGILVPRGTWPQSYTTQEAAKSDVFMKNLTMSRALSSSGLENLGNGRWSPIRGSSRMIKGDSTQSPQKQEHSVCNANASTLRSRKHRLRSKVINSSRHSDRRCLTVPCRMCHELVVSPLVAVADEPRIDAIRRSPLGRRAGNYSRLFIAALDELIFPSASLRVHRVFMEFYSPSPDDRELSAFGHGRNRAIREHIFARGVRVNYVRYPGGFTRIEPRMTDSPIAPRKLPEFMKAIKALLPFESPEIVSWRIAMTDANYDLPTLERQKRNIEFNFKGFKIRAYNKTINGQRVLRLETQLYPGITLAGYPAAIEKAMFVLLEAIGK